MAQWGMMRHRGLRSVHEKRQVMADMSSIEIQIVSDSYANIDTCWLLLINQIEKAYIMKPVAIDEDLAKSLSESQVCKKNNGFVWNATLFCFPCHQGSAIQRKN